MNSVKYLLFYMELFCDMFESVLKLTHISRSHARVSMHCYPIGCVIKNTHRCICSCSPIVNFLKFTFYRGMVTSVIFLIKNLNRHIKHENPLSIYENVDYFQITSITNLEWFCINCSMISYWLLLSSMLWYRQAIFKSKGDKLCSSAECRIWTRDPRHQIASRLNARWQTDWAIENQAKTWTKHACTSSWLPLAHSEHHTYHQVTVMIKQQKKQRL